MRSRTVVPVLTLLIGALLSVASVAAEPPVVIPAAALDNPKAAGPTQTAVLAGGCFWGVQGVFQHMVGVQRVLSGYAGGDKNTAHYETVSGGRTGHAESVEIVFDPKLVTYGEILRVFFSVAHDPTQLNRQGPDSGTQYRSAIFYTDEMQQKIAQAYIAQLDKAAAWRKPIVTRVDALQAFFPAEDYHQDYLVLNPTAAYIAINDMPKVRNFQKVLPTYYQAKATTVSAALR